MGQPQHLPPPRATPHPRLPPPPGSAPLQSGSESPSRSWVPETLGHGLGEVPEGRQEQKVVGGQGVASSKMLPAYSDSDMIQGCHCKQHEPLLWPWPW